MISNHKVTEIYFIIDEFYKEFDKLSRDHSITRCKKQKQGKHFTKSRKS
jgi:hypothetical protein